MSLRSFFDLVEIKTKIASLFPFVIGSLFSLTYFGQFHWQETLLFFVGMIIFDMTTTAINNYMDYQKAHSAAYKHEENVIGKDQLSVNFVQGLIVGMILFTAGIGLYLSFRTGWLLLVMGLVCCFIGVFYTAGPIPLSRMPLGEVFSGFTMGLGIFVMVVYLNTYDQKAFFLDLHFASGRFVLEGNFWQVAALVLASLPLVFMIANIMLANNLRDLETDIENHRYTLVYYIGRDTGLKLFSGLVYGSYGAILLGLLLGVFEWPILLVFLTLPKLRQNLAAHKAELPAPHSFVYSLKNMVRFNSSYALGLVATLVWQYFR
ncbi:1,4-dihydroxy-2-naphthoate polyprenyltransferase [Enterococcus sp. 2201sp1_2201st1_B8_2201SCRN_220225]|uniref:1,4-dihydroxy-2-naphthoate polyprenyltransferase n=2 Tax=unclassified Enterococcus TaxID=2608891 RepID=UPI0034A3D89A